MSLLNFIIMVVMLIAVIVLLVAAIVYLNIEFYREKRSFRIKLEVLQNAIAEISQKQSGQLGQIRLSEELEETLKSANAKLSTHIFGLNYELFELLSKNKLLKK
jgi:predicted Holliday junction resolvase-like endonuclease